MRSRLLALVASALLAGCVDVPIFRDDFDGEALGFPNASPPGEPEGDALEYPRDNLVITVAPATPGVNLGTRSLLVWDRPVTEAAATVITCRAKPGSWTTGTYDYWCSVAEWRIDSPVTGYVTIEPFTSTSKLHRLTLLSDMSGNVRVILGDALMPDIVGTLENRELLLIHCTLDLDAGTASYDLYSNGLMMMSRQGLPFLGPERDLQGLRFRITDSLVYLDGIELVWDF